MLEEKLIFKFSSFQPFLLMNNPACKQARHLPWRPTSCHQQESPSRGSSTCACAAEDVGVGMAEWKLIHPVCDLCSYPSQNQWQLHRGFPAARCITKPMHQLWEVIKGTSPAENWTANILLSHSCLFLIHLHSLSWIYRNILHLHKAVEGSGVFNSANTVCRPEQTSQGTTGQEGSFSSCQTDVAVAWKCSQHSHLPGNLGNWIGL